jgi:GH18 family chitinase
MGAVLALGACAPRTGTAPNALTPIVTEPIPLPESQAFLVVGYVTQAVVVEAIPYDQVTHINYAFLIPNADGTFKTLPNGWKLEQTVEKAHQYQVQVLISVGGWGWDDEFEAMAADPATREVFVRDLARFVDEYQLDGADIDWEYPNPGESAQNFLALIRELRAAMPDKLITTAVVSRGGVGEGVLPETFEYFDFVNIMAYDGGEPHSPYELAEDSLDYWLGRGLPPEKAVLGLPFYAHPTFVPYRKIVEDDPQAAHLDESEYMGTLLDYNGIPTIERKTKLAKQRGSGVMIWTLEHDSQDDLSLLSAINRAVFGE